MRTIQGYFLRSFVSVKEQYHGCQSKKLKSRYACDILQCSITVKSASICMQMLLMLLSVATFQCLDLRLYAQKLDE